MPAATSWVAEKCRRSLKLMCGIFSRFRRAVKAPETRSGRHGSEWSATWDQTNASAANSTPSASQRVTARALCSMSTASVMGSRAKRRRFLFLVAESIATPLGNTFTTFSRPATAAAWPLGRSEQRHQIVACGGLRVDVAEAQPADLASAHPGGGVYEDQRRKIWVGLADRQRQAAGFLGCGRDTLVGSQRRCFRLAGRVRRRQPPPTDGLVEGGPDERVVVVAGGGVAPPTGAAASRGQPGVELVQVKSGQAADVLAADVVGLDVPSPAAGLQKCLGSPTPRLLVAEVLVEQFGQGVASDLVATAVDLGQQLGRLRLDHFGIALRTWATWRRTHRPGDLPVPPGFGVAPTGSDGDLPHARCPLSYPRHVAKLRAPTAIMGSIMG